MIRICRYGEVPAGEIFARKEKTASVREAVEGIIAEVRTRGDAALRDFSLRFDGAVPEPLEVTEEMFAQAMEEVGAPFAALLERAAANIRAYHSRQLREGFEMSGGPGVVLGQRVSPIARVGICVPGDTAAYPSSVLMNAIPAKIAGCGEIVMVSPPSVGGRIHPAILAAAKIAGVDRVFQIGGAQAVAALAYGTESVPAVDKIVGPGGAFVAEAKRQVFGRVAIDMIAGPSEILVVADGKSDPVCVAADMLSQAEHDKNASAVLVTDSEALARAVAEEIERQLRVLPREEIARASVENNGRIIVADDIAQAVDIANEIAPEHLELCVEDPFALFGKVRNAGSVFLGRWCPEAVGDYYAGPNHTLPTQGTARFSSALGVDDFIKKSQYMSYTREALESAAGDIRDFARREGLEGHARSVLSRFREEGET